MTKIKQHPDNKPTDQHLVALTQLCTNALDFIREEFGPVIITSGYRNPAYNKKIGGAISSQHQFGTAADFIVPRQDLYDVFEWIKSEMLFDQVIFEIKDGKEWIHFSYLIDPHSNRREALTSKFDDQKMTYQKVT